MNRLVVATTNPGKVREINGILAGIEPRITLLALDQFSGLVEPEETGETFADNARLKAFLGSTQQQLDSRPSQTTRDWKSRR